MVSDSEHKVHHHDRGGGRMNPRKSERNRQMLKDRNSGMMLKDLAKKYDLSLGRISLVLANQRRWEEEDER